MLDVIPFTVNGKDYTLRPDFKTIVAIERETGLGIIGIAQRMAAGQAGTTELLAILKCGLASGSGKVDDDGAQKILQDLGLIDALGLCSNFMEMALAPPKKPCAPAAPAGEPAATPPPGETITA